jgi:hypothetical protein
MMTFIVVKLSFEQEYKIVILKTIYHDVVEYQFQRERTYKLMRSRLPVPKREQMLYKL